MALRLWLALLMALAAATCGCTALSPPRPPQATLQASITLPSPATRQEKSLMVFTINITYTVGAGPPSASQVELQDELPNALVPEAAVVLNNPAAVCIIKDQKLSCVLGDIAQGSTATVRLTARAAALPDTAASLGVVHRVAATCGNAAACRAEAEVAVLIRRAPPAVQIRLTAKNATALYSRMTIVFTIWNGDNVPVTNARFSGTIPPGFGQIGLVSKISPEAGTCALAVPGGGAMPDLGYGGYVSCMISSLTKPETVRVRVFAREAGTFTIQGGASWPTAGADGPQRNSSVSTQVVIA